MSTTETIESRVKAFKASSAFTPGDPFSFSVPLADEIALPGKYDPKDYLRPLAIPVLSKKVCVVCPGNGGLAVACLRAGAETVVAFEPRHLYHKSLDTISSFSDELSGVSFKVEHDAEKLRGPFDLILWSEGVDDIQSPKRIIDKVFEVVESGGLLCIEVSHGAHGVLPESINCWRPSAEAFEETVLTYDGFEIVSKISGRNQVRVIYTIRNTREAPTESKTLSGPESIEDVEKLADELKPVVKEPLQEVTTPKTAAERVANKIKKVFEEPEEQPPISEELDEIYDWDTNPDEDRISTPKDRKKGSDQTEPERRGKKGKSKQ